LRSEHYLLNFVRPAEPSFFWRYNWRLAMTLPNALEAFDRKDYAIGGPVRAGSYQFCGIVRPASVALGLCLLWAGFVVAAPRSTTPDMAFVERTIATYFATLPDYEPGDLITKTQIEHALTKLADSGAPVPRADKIIERGLEESSFVAKELATESGRRFMRRLARDPSTFSHLDRLSKIPRGENLIRDLIHQKDGDKMIEYLATTKGGRNMGKMMANVHNGTDLNKPTGRIYTVDDLLAAIKTAYTTPF
jgi:hypothetical protein